MRDRWGLASFEEVHHLDLILTLTGGLGAALLLGLVTQQLKLSPIVGYLLAGVVVGPYTPGYTANKALADQLAEIGVVLLMFGVGLQLHVKELLGVWRVAVPGAIGQIAVATALGAFTMRAFDWSWSSGIIFGLSISVASTVVLVRVLSDHRALHTPTGRVAIGWLVLEDLFTVFVLVILPALFAPAAGASSGGGLIAAVGWAFLKLCGLIAFTFMVGDRLLPKLLEYVVKTGSRELFTLAILVVALGIALGSAELFGASMALGAFLAGIIVGRSDFALRAASEALPMRDAFAVLFFVSVGMLFEPRFILEHPAMVAATVAIIVIGKPLVAIAIVRVLRYPSRVALSVGIALGQIGEFSFILATFARGLDVLPREATSTLVAASILTITVNPLLYRLVPHFERWLPRVRAASSSAGEPSSSSERSQFRAVLVGFGPVGESVARLLEQSGIEPTIVELNMDTAKRLRALGKRAVYGDATRREVLEEAGIAKAIALVVSVAVEPGNSEVVRLAREVNPNLLIAARCSFLREANELRAAGASAVFTGEGEVALAMTVFILRQLGATPEQIDRETERLRSELNAESPVHAAPTVSADPRESRRDSNLLGS